MKVIAVIPAYNEEKTIKAVIENIKKKVDDVVVVDDGSRDRTFNLAKSAGAIVLKHIVNRGQGAALETGTSYALKIKADIIVHFDADGQHKVEDVDKLIKPILNDGFDVILGSRFLGQKSNVPLIKEIFILKPAIILNRFFTGLRLTDVHNGLRAFSRKAAKKIKITQDKMAHNTEIPAEIHKNGLKWQEVAVEIIYKEYGQGFMGGVRILKDLFLRKII